MLHLKILLLVLTPCWLGAQLQIMNTSSQTVLGDINLIEDRWIRSSNMETPQTTISNLRIEISNGDVIISYRLSPLEEDQHYEILPLIRLDGRQLLLSTDEFRGDMGRPIGSGDKQIIWINPLERYVNLEGRLEVTLTAKQWGEVELPYDCALGEPTFTSSQRRKYLIAAGIGVAAIGAGQLIKSQRDDAYDQYQNAQNLSEATPLYDDANGKNHTYLILTWAGTGILVADAVFYYIRQRKYKRDLDNYNTFCRLDDVGLRPVLELPSGNAPNGSVGVRITIPIGRRP